VEIKELIKKEKMKYNNLYLTDNKYGWKSGRPKIFLRGNDKIHTFVKRAIQDSKTILDVGCGRGYFTDFFKREYPHLKITCIDIAAKEIRKYRPDMNIIEASADNIPFPDNFFDLVVHLDGMEHIPAEIEEKTFVEEYRVSKKYVYHQIATHSVARDKDWIAKGLGAIHINLKTPEEWKLWFDKMSFLYRMKVLNFVDYRLWAHVLLEKKIHKGTVCNND